MPLLFSLLLLIVLAGSAAAQQDQPVFQANTAEVRLDVQVSQGRRLISTLTKDDFLVFDESDAQKLTYFGREAEPLTLILLLDVSGSMSRFIREMSRTALQALQLLRPGDQVAIMVYGRRSKLHFDFSSNFEEVARRLESAPENPYVGSGTSTNEAVIAAAQMLAKRTTAASGRKSILVVTDNGGLNYQVPDEQVMQELYASNTVLNGIAVGKAERPKKAPSNANPDFTPTDIFKLSEQSGGEALKSDRTSDTFLELMERIRTRYALAYPAPQGLAPKTYRRVRVELTHEAKKRHPDAQIRVRGGYYVQ
jgi:VWFA-related protein